MHSRSACLKKFVKLCFDNNQGKLKKVLETITDKKLSRQNISHYMNTEKPSTQLVNWLWEAGLDSNYYLHGKGNMFADNEAGQQLRNKFGNEGIEIAGETIQASQIGISEKDILGIINSWINYNFGSNDYFAMSQGLNEDEIEEYTSGEKRIDDGFNQILRNAGFNFTGIFYKDESLYMNNERGKALQEKMESLTLKKSELSDEYGDVTADIRTQANREFFVGLIKEVLNNQKNST